MELPDPVAAQPLSSGSLGVPVPKLRNSTQSFPVPELPPLTQRGGPATTAGTLTTPTPGVPKPAKTPGNDPAAKLGMLEPQYTAAFSQWRAEPTPENRSWLLSQVKPVLQTAYKTYGIDNPTVQQRGKLLALDAMSRYDPEKGTLKTHLISQLAGLQRVSADTQNVVHVPEQIALDRLYLQRTEKELEDELGRPPNDEELADHTNLSRKRIAYVRRYKPAVASSQIRGTDEETGESEEIDAGATSLTPRSAADDPWVQIVYSGLSPTDKVIMDMTLGLNGSQVSPGKVVAERLKISPAAVSMRAAKIQQLLDEREDHNLF